jgi:hypothetical protein
MSNVCNCMQFLNTPQNLTSTPGCELNASLHTPKIRMETPRFVGLFFICHICVLIVFEVLSNSFACNGNVCACVRVRRHFISTALSSTCNYSFAVYAFGVIAALYFSTILVIYER